MLDYGSDLSEQLDCILFPEVKFPTEFGNYINNALAFLKRVSRLADYMNGKETDVFFHGTAEDIVANPSVGLDRTMHVRASIVYYLNKDKEIFVNHLPFFCQINK